LRIRGADQKILSDFLSPGESTARAEESMAGKINVLLVDHSRTVLAQIEHVLSEIDDLAIVGMAQNGAAAIRMASESKPDLVLMGIVMPGLDGLSALRTIKSMHPGMHVAMISSVGDDAAKAEKAFRLGACQVIGRPFDEEVMEMLVENTRADLPEETQEAADFGAEEDRRER
jgi:two-component system chemotaxis response regulator CheY